MFDMITWAFRWGVFLVKVTIQGAILVVAGLLAFTIITSL